MADAVVVPGRMAGPWSPLPLYSGDVAERRGATVHRFEWTEEPPERPDVPQRDWIRLPEVTDWVCGQVTPVLDSVGGSPLLIGKSLGTMLAGVATERSLPAIWLTPLLIVPSLVDQWRAATAPFLLVGGTADLAWDSAVAHRLTRYVLEIPDANHGMYVPGPLSASIAVLDRLIETVDDFLRDIGWPADHPSTAGIGPEPVS